MFAFMCVWYVCVCVCVCVCVYVCLGLLNIFTILSNIFVWQEHLLHRLANLSNGVPRLRMQWLEKLAQHHVYILSDKRLLVFAGTQESLRRESASVFGYRKSTCRSFFRQPNVCLFRRFLKTFIINRCQTTFIFVKTFLIYEGMWGVTRCLWATTGAHMIF